MKRIVVLFLVLQSSLFFGQFTGSLESNSQWYVDDEHIGGFNEDERFRSNNYLNLNYFLNKFTAAVKFESYAPKALLNYSPRLDKTIGLAAFSIKYKNKNLDLTLGNFYDQFGSGLIFRSFEDRQLGVDNSIGGFRIKYQPKNLSVTSFIGKQRVGFDLSDGIIFGFNSELDLSSLVNKNISIGFSYIGRNQKLPDDITSDISETLSLFSARINYSYKKFYSNLEYVHKGDDPLIEFESIIDSRLFDGNAILFNLGYTKKRMGLDASFRRLENIAVYVDRAAYLNVYNDQLINYTPSLTKQHHFSLSNIYVYQAQPQLAFIPFGKSGEIGGQFDIFYKFKKNSLIGGEYGTLISFNYSQWHRLKTDYDLANRTYKSDYFGFGNKNFSDFNVSLNKKWSKKTKTILTFMSLFYDKDYLEEKIGQINASIVAAEVNYKINSKKSTRLQLEHLFTQNDKKNWLAGSLEFNFSNKFSLYANEQYNYGNDFNDDKIHYYNIGGNYNTGKTRVSLNYGRQRGGLICIGGICRFVPNSTGLSVSLNTNF